MSTQTVRSREQARCGKRPDSRLTLRNDQNNALDEDVDVEKQALARSVELDDGDKVDDDVDEDLEAERDVDDDLGNDLGNELDLNRVAEVDDGADVDACGDKGLDEDRDLVDVDRDVRADVETSCGALPASQSAKSSKELRKTLTNNDENGLDLDLELETEVENDLKLIVVRGAQSELGASGLSDRASEREHRKGKKAKQDREEARLLHNGGEGGGEATRVARRGLLGLERLSELEF